MIFVIEISIVRKLVNIGLIEDSKGKSKKLWTAVNELTFCRKKVTWHQFRIVFRLVAYSLLHGRS